MCLDHYEITDHCATSLKSYLWVFLPAVGQRIINKITESCDSTVWVLLVSQSYIRTHLTARGQIQITFLVFYYQPYIVLTYKLNVAPDWFFESIATQF